MQATFDSIQWIAARSDQNLIATNARCFIGRLWIKTKRREWGRVEIFIDRSIENEEQKMFERICWHAKINLPWPEDDCRRYFIVIVGAVAQVLLGRLFHLLPHKLNKNVVRYKLDQVIHFTHLFRQKFFHFFSWKPEEQTWLLDEQTFAQTLNFLLEPSTTTLTIWESPRKKLVKIY